MALVSNILQHEIARKSVTSKMTEQDIRIFDHLLSIICEVVVCTFSLL